MNGSYQYALEGTSAFLGFHYGRVMNPNADNVRHAIKAQWDWTIPVGRGAALRRQHAPDPQRHRSAAGSSTAPSRIQARMVDFGNVRLVGMIGRAICRRCTSSTCA